jgi:phosphoglycerate kinase
MKTVRDIQVLDSIPVLVRAALNVPVADGKVVNTFRLQKALPTIQYLQGRKARIILIGHIGEKGTETLMPVYEAMKELIPELMFSPVTIGADVRAAVRELSPGGVLMLENLRRDKGEVMNDPAFARALAELGDVFVEDSFDVCHRSHASVVGIPKFLPSYAGLLVEEEVKQLSKALSPEHPALTIIGGAKFNTKEPVITRLLEIYDRVFVGGALGNDFIKAKGFEIGKSLVSETDPKEIKELLANRKLALPLDSVVSAVNGKKEESRLSDLNGMTVDEAIRDNGPKTTVMLDALIQNAKTILWNGPLGSYENGFTDATKAVALSIAKSSAYSIVGGGDTEAAIEELNVRTHFSFISTGGGAMLDFLAKGTLPGISVLEQKEKTRGSFLQWLLPRREHR